MTKAYTVLNFKKVDLPYLLDQIRNVLKLNVRDLSSDGNTLRIVFEGDLNPVQLKNVKGLLRINLAFRCVSEKKITGGRLE